MRVPKRDAGTPGGGCLCPAPWGPLFHLGLSEGDRAGSPPTSASRCSRPSSEVRDSHRPWDATCVWKPSLALAPGTSGFRGRAQEQLSGEELASHRPPPCQERVLSKARCGPQNKEGCLALAPAICHPRICGQSQGRSMKSPEAPPDSRARSARPLPNDRPVFTLVLATRCPHSCPHGPGPVRGKHLSVGFAQPNA